MTHWREANRRAIGDEQPAGPSLAHTHTRANSNVIPFASSSRGVTTRQELATTPVPSSCRGFYRTDERELAAYWFGAICFAAPFVLFGLIYGGWCVYDAVFG